MYLSLGIKQAPSPGIAAGNCGVAHRQRVAGGSTVEAMSVKYYTQFRLTDASYRGGNEFAGVIELSRPLSTPASAAEIEAVLARNFDLNRDSIKLLSWARVH